MTLLQKIREKCIEANPEKVCPHSATCKGPRCSVIRLADVLLAIGNMLVVVDCWGNMYQLSMKLSDKLPKFDKKNPTARWNLRRDNLEDQSPETLEFISKVLEV